MNIKISENIKRLRKAKKITQEGLAEIFNVTPAAVSKWENNETYPDITLLFPLSHKSLIHQRWWENKLSDLKEHYPYRV